MKVLFAVCAMLLIALPALATVTIDFENYTAGYEIVGQQGWYYTSSSGQNQIASGDNGPTQAGNQAALLDVNPTNAVVFAKDIANQVVAGADLVLQYDLKLVTSDGGAWMAVRTADASGMAGPPGHMTSGLPYPHLDSFLFWGGSNGVVASVDVAGWHQYAWRYDFVNKKIVSLTIDGGAPIVLDKPFYSAGASAVTQLQIKLYTAAGTGQFALDNVMITSVPEPGSLLALAVGLVGVAPFVRRKK